VGSYDEQAKGVRTAIRLSGLSSETVTLLWAKRSSGPSPRELSALTTLLSEANTTKE